MNDLIHFITVLLLITLVYLNGRSRLDVLIYTVAFQGAIVGFLPMILHYDSIDLAGVIIGSLTALIKGVAIPYFLFRAIRGIGISRDTEPSIGYTLSILITIGLLFLCFWLGHRIQSLDLFPAPLFVSVGSSMVCCGLFLLITRKKALTQVIGYLVLENGIFLFGVSLGVAQSWVVELGVLLDVLVCVFIMAIVIHRINQEFDTISIKPLEALRE